MHADRIVSYLRRHRCPPRLFDDYALPVRMSKSNGITRRLYVGNGANDPRFIRISTVPGTVSVEQFAVSLGVVAGTARDIVTARRGGPSVGYSVNGTILVPTASLIEAIKERTP